MSSLFTWDIAEYFGYCYLQKEEYTKALSYFDKCVTQLEKTTKETKEEKTYFDNVYPDALVRLGDCYFTAQNYSKSSEAYSKVISKNWMVLIMPYFKEVCWMD